MEGVCAWVCLYVCSHVLVSLCMLTLFPCRRLWERGYVHICNVCLYVSKCLHMLRVMCIHCMCVHVHVCVCVYMCVCVHVCVLWCVCVCVCLNSVVKLSEWKLWSFAGCFYFCWFLISSERISCFSVGLCLVWLLFHWLYCFVSVSSTQRFYFYFQYQVIPNSNLTCNLMCTTGYAYIHTYIVQVYKFLNSTQLLCALIYSSKEYSLFENFSWIVFSLFSFCLNTRLVGLTTPPASSCSKDTSVAVCSVLNSSTISCMFGWLFPARQLILFCNPSTWLFVHGPSSLYADHSEMW